MNPPRRPCLHPATSAARPPRAQRLLPFTLAVLLGACGGGGDSLALAGGGSTGGGSSGSTPGTTPGSGAAASCAGVPGAAELIAAINAARATARSCGGTAYPAAAPLAWHDALAAAASEHSQDMAAQNYFSHTSLDGRSMSDRAANAGYPGGTLAENIAAGTSTVQATLDLWINSPGHCANLMGASYKDAALACASSARSTYGEYWTFMAGAR